MKTVCWCRESVCCQGSDGSSSVPDARGDTLAIRRRFASGLNEASTRQLMPNQQRLQLHQHNALQGGTKMAQWSSSWKKGKRRGQRFELRKFQIPPAANGPLYGRFIVCSADAPDGNGRPTGTVRA